MKTGFEHVPSNDAGQRRLCSRVSERSVLRYRRQFGRSRRGADEDTPLKDFKVPILVGLEGDNGYPLKGTLDFIDNKVNPSTGTMLGRGILANPKRLMDDGMRARVSIPVSDPHKVLLVSDRAIGSDQSQRFVYVVNDKNVVERRDVKPGRLIDGLRTIEEGLRPGERIVVNGIQRVRDQLEVKPEEAAMPGTALSDKPPMAKQSAQQN